MDLLETDDGRSLEWSYSAATPSVSIFQPDEIDTYHVLNYDYSQVFVQVRDIALVKIVAIILDPGSWRQNTLVCIHRFPNSKKH